MAAPPMSVNCIYEVGPELAQRPLIPVPVTSDQVIVIAQAFGQLNAGIISNDGVHCVDGDLVAVVSQSCLQSVGVLASLSIVLS